MGKVRGRYKPKDDNVKKLIEFLKKIEKKHTENKITDK